MAKIKSKWICQNCGYESRGYLGKCPDCNSWGTLTEELSYQENSKQTKSKILTSNSENKNTPKLLQNIEIDETIRFSTGLNEFDRVLGGGFVVGSLVLLAGEPGIGKSTLLLQSCNNLSEANQKVLYISAEESSNQIKLRAERLNINSSSLYIYAETNFNNILSQIKELKPETIIVDSIQAIYNPDLTSSPGSVSQVRECCNLLMNVAKAMGITVIVVGHVTKDGTIAGPKVLEHMVDAVLHFEGEKYKSFRLLRSNKNRFGSTNDVGVFNMEDTGLIEVDNPSELFLSERCETITPGSVVIATNEGTRPLLVEIQALVGTTSYASPRRVSTGIEHNRVLQIIAVLEKRVGLDLSKQDVYVNVVGGIDINEPAADLGVAIAIATCTRNVIAHPDAIIIGEMGLSGEIRTVTQLETRINEAQKLGFKKAIIPNGNLPIKNSSKNFEITGVSRIIEAIKHSIKS